MSTHIETREHMEFGMAEEAQAFFRRSSDGARMRHWLAVALCTMTAPFVFAQRLRRKWSTGRDLERLDRHVLTDIGLVQADVVAAVNGHSLAQAMPANNNELCPLSGGRGGVA